MLGISDYNLLTLCLDQIPAQPPSQDNNIMGAYASPHTQVSELSPELEQWQNTLSLDMDFLGFDFLDQWQHIEQPDFAGWL